MKEVIKQVRKEIGPVASFKLAVVVPKLPKTKSGKVPRSTVAAMAAGKPYKVWLIAWKSFFGTRICLTKRRTCRDKNSHR